MSGPPPDGRAASPYIPVPGDVHKIGNGTSMHPGQPGVPPAISTARDNSTSRARAQSNASHRAVSPRAVNPAAPGRPKQSLDIERRPSLSYGHHRQTSIVHGVQHSRNLSLLSGPAAAPLSPAKIMESGRDGEEEVLLNGHTLRKSPSASTLQQAAAGMAGKSPDAGTVRRPQRMHSARTKRSGDEHTPLGRENKPLQTQTVGEYALHHLFTSFIAEAEQRILQFIPTLGQPDVRVEAICGPGADAGFDQLIRSLGHINRHKPKPVIDAVMLWRKQKKDAVMLLLEKLCPNPEQLQRLEEVYAAGYVTTSSLSPREVHLSQTIFNRHDFVVADIKCQVSTYILCRALVDIISQTTVEAMNAYDPDFTAKLENIVFHQLEDHDVGLARRNSMQQATLAMRGRLLGVMSGLRFSEVAKRFTSPLDEDFRYLSWKSPPAQLNEKDRAEWKEKWEEANTRTPLLLRSMRWLKFSTQPERAWNTSCETIQLLARFFAEIHGRHIKHAYADLLEHILLPIAAVGSAEFNVPKWKDTIERIRPRVTQMLTKADHWSYAYPLQAVLLCVSPGELFAAQWMSTITSFQAKNRDRSAKSHALKATCRLVWRYLYRLSDSPIAVARKMDEIIKHVFQTSRRLLISTDPIIADPLIQLIRIIGYKNQDLCFRTIIFPLMNYDLLTAQGDGLSIEHLDPEKTVIGIRAFLAIMTDLEKGEPPPFPTSFECDALLDPISRNLNVSHRRTRSLGFAVSAGRTELLSQPIVSANLTENERGYYAKFCAMLATLTKICDRDFGGEAALNEKINANVPKTPRADTFAAFGRREDPASAAELRQNYYDLLHVAVEALPRCLSPALPLSELVSLLCTGTAHVQSHIAASSAQSLKSIARHSYAQVITLGFARFIFNFDDKYATVSDGGLLGPGHIESTLKLYVELLSIWIDSLEQKTKQSSTKNIGQTDEQSARPPGFDLSMSGIHAMVDEVEAHGLFFLCSPSQVVRAVAVDVLKLVTKFDVALGKPCDRIINILEGSSEQVIDVNDERLTLAERSRLQKGLKNANNGSTLVELCSSDIEHDANLWFKIFSTIVARSLDICFSTVALTREIVCKRLTHAQATIEWHAQQTRPHFALETSSFGPRSMNRPTVNEVVIEQWKLHLIFVCTTLTKIGKTQHLAAPGQSGQQHVRKSSKSSTSTEEAVIVTATELFPKVVGFLFAPNQAVRDAAVIGLGATNVTLFQALLESLHPAVQECLQESKVRADVHQRTVSSPRRNPRTDTCRLGVTRLLCLTVHLLKDPTINGDEYVMEYMSNFAKHLRTWLGDADIQGHVEYHKLRTYFCAFMEGLYDATKRLQHASRWLSFHSRQATFQLMENWCGFSPNEQKLREHEIHFRRSILDREQDPHHRGIINAAIEKEKSELQIAALSAMATLCAGPLSFIADSKILMQFNMRRILTWIDAIFETPSDRTHATGRKALQNLIVNNPGDQQLMAQSLRMCYTARLPKALTSYFEVVTNVLTNHANVQVPFWKVLCVGLYTLGNEDSNIRMKSVKLLRLLEERQEKVSRLQDRDISVSDKTTAVYKLAQFEISCRLAKHHSELTFHVFSEFSAYFNELHPDDKRNMVTGMLPWIQSTELMLDPGPQGQPTATSYMLLVNLFEITVKSRNTMHHEIQALWQALATGPYGGNVQLILDFIINLCLSRREQNFVIYAKQIVVFLAGTAAGSKVVEYLMMQIRPATMIAEKRASPTPPVDTTGLPYIADLNDILPSGSRQGGLSLGQLSMILLVDLIVTPDKVALDKLPILLQVILVSWDHYTIIIQEQARELLVHLIHELVISKIEPSSTEPDKHAIEDFVELLRTNDPKIMWAYEDSEVHSGAELGRAVCQPTGFVVDECVRIFSVVYPDIRDEWGKVAILWATQCAVRHVACRSFQVFRCTSKTLDQQMLSDMLARLSNTIADDEHADFLIFSLEILITLRCIVADIDPLDLLEYPQLFWTTCACLDTIFEAEFREGLSMLSHLLDKLDLSDPAVIKLLEDSKPPKWKGEFNGVHRLVWKGVRSAKSMDRALLVMDRLVKLPSNSLVGVDGRLLLTVLANLPRFIQVYDEPNTFELCKASAEALSYAAESQNYVQLNKTLQAFAGEQIRSKKEFLVKSIDVIRLTFFPTLEFRCLVSLLGMVNNQADWFKVNTMDVINIILKDVDMRKPEIASQGPDLITPLLRLLQTKHCQQALEVLDNVVDMTGTPLDNKHLRMSMIGSHSSRASRKEYSTTKSLHGIPDESGWSVPMPAMHSQRTRSNVHAVFGTLAYSDQDGEKHVATTPEISFQRDDDHLDSYFAERTATMRSEIVPADGNMGELALKLDSLDDFFEDDDDMTATAGSPRYPSGPIEQRENLYEQQALPILHRSLQRTPSMTSLSELHYQSRPEPTQAMNPAAFAQTARPPRPSMHNRSVTTPVAMTRSPPRLDKDLMSGDEAGDEPEPFSDDDLSIGRAHTSDEQLHMTTNVRPAWYKGNFKQGLKRLANTSNSRDGLKAVISAPLKSPKMPKVPAAFLAKDAKSGEP